MPSARPVIRHRIAGGWGPDFGPTAEVDASTGVVSVPWLVNAENLLYKLDGGFRKVGGTTRLNSSALESGAQVYGLFDYWRQGSAAVGTQKRIVHVGTTVQKDDADGSFSSILTGMTDAAIPSYAVYDDDLIIMSDAAADVPRSYDQSSASVLGTNTPNGSFGVTHKNRFWMAGVLTDSSRLYYSQPLPLGAGGDWDGAEAGSIAIDPGDGDRITGLVSHKNELFVFKGPYHGSIHRIEGSSPSGLESSGASAFARRDYVKGIGSVNHNSIFKFRDDVGFVWSDGSVHSLNATPAFGDYIANSLSFPFNEWILERGNHDRLKFSWADTLVAQGIVVITLAVDTSTDNNILLIMDYRFMSLEGAPRWSQIPSIGAACVANVIDAASNDTPSIFIGDNAGFIRRWNQPGRSINNTTEYTAKMTFPFLHYGAPMQTKILGNMGIGIQPFGSVDTTVAWTRDDNTQQTQTVAQGGGDVLASGIGTGSITAFADAGSGNVTVTSASHGNANGTEISIRGTTSYNGRFEVANSATNTFTIIAAFVADDATGDWQTATEANFFLLGVSSLGGSQFVDRFLDIEQGGEFRSIQFEVQQSGVNQDLEMHSLTAEINPGALSTEN